MNNLGKVYSRLNTSLQKTFCTAWTFLPKISNENPNCIKLDDGGRTSSSFSGIFKRPSKLDLLKNSQIGVQTVCPYLEVFNCAISFRQGDYVQDSDGVKYQIKSIEHMERGTQKLTLAYGVSA